MSESLLEDLVEEMDSIWTERELTDKKLIKDRFIEAGREYVAEADDISTETVEFLVDLFEDRDPEDLDEETIVWMWSMECTLRWMLDDLPLQHEFRDPEWLRSRLRLFGKAPESGSDEFNRI